jgi:cellulose synthase/poly-beta-1,6-N-acetylglucosamine synthase-like glycosyltransferase
LNVDLPIWAIIFPSIKKGICLKLKYRKSGDNSMEAYSFPSKVLRSHRVDKPIGEILVETGTITHEQLLEALLIQKKIGGRIGWILMSLGWISRLDFFRSLADHYQLAFYSINHKDSKLNFDKKLLKTLSSGEVIKYHFFPISVKKDQITILTDYPYKKDTVEFLKNRFRVKKIDQLIITDLDFIKLVQDYFGKSLVDHSIYGLFYRNPEESSYAVFNKNQIIAFAILAIILLVWFYVDAVSLLVSVFATCQIIFFTTVAFKSILSFIGAYSEIIEPISVEETNALKDDELPVYSILVPAYKEPAVLPTLINAIKKMDYPQNKLDVILLLEEDDEFTLKTAKRAKPPGNWRFIIVPKSHPKTKPKACNYGVFFSRGKFLTIYDAEDIPEPDQLKKALVAFEKGGPSFFCFQAALNYFNKDENLITSLFTLEYSYWFDYLLPGLYRLNLPIPLGGTSNHFRLSYLKKMGAWDPFNVTEDADLGIRACAHSLKVGIINSTTYEEANSRYLNWIRQRSRWIKGYMQTVLVYNRHPIKMLKQIGLKNWLAFQLFVGGTPLLFLINPIVWAIFLYWTATQTKLFDPFLPPLLTYIALYNLLIGNFLGIYLNMIAVFRRKLYRLLPLALLNPFYWLFFHSIAAYKALWQLIVRPFYWEKTKHGISYIKKEI